MQVVTVQLSRGILATQKDLERVIKSAREEDIILIPRASLSPTLLNQISLDAFDGHDPSASEWAGRWNETGNTNPKNAIPHAHGVRNCHAAPTPTRCETLFFERDATIQAIDELSLSRMYHIEIRLQIGAALRELQRTGDVDEFFDTLHTMEPPRSVSQFEVLRFVQDLQKKLHSQNATFSVSLAEDGYAIVGIPASALHGRSLLEDYARLEKTAWRYFE